jgi:hypothetical protein
LHEIVCEFHHNFNGIDTRFCNYFKNKADVREVKHGKWKMGIDEADYEYGTCSVCGYIEWDAFGHGDYPFFCSRCGAKMDGGKNG